MQIRTYTDNDIQSKLHTVMHRFVTNQSRKSTSFFFFCLDNDYTYNNLSVPYFQEGYVHYVVDAVFTLVIAIEKLISEKCSNSSRKESLCQEFYPFDGIGLLSILRNVSFRNGKNASRSNSIVC